MWTTWRPPQMTIADRSGLRNPRLADIVIEDLHKRNLNLPVAAGTQTQASTHSFARPITRNPTSQNDGTRG